MERWAWICVLLIAAIPATTAAQEMAPSEAEALRQEIAELRKALAKCESQLETIEKRLPAPPWEPDAAAESPRLALDGFCPVALVETMDTNSPVWTPGNPAISEVRGGLQHLFSSRQARDRFNADPFQYALVMQGCDVVIAQQESRRVPGCRNWGARWRGRIYVFANKESYDRFHSSPCEFEQFAHRSALAEAQRDLWYAGWRCFYRATPVRAALAQRLLETGVSRNERQVVQAAETALPADIEPDPVRRHGSREDTAADSDAKTESEPGEPTEPWLADYFRARLHLLVPAE